MTVRRLRDILVHPAGRLMGHRNGSGLGELPVSGHASNSDQHPERAFFPNLLAQTTHFQNLGVSQQPLARDETQSSRARKRAARNAAAGGAALVEPHQVA